MFLTALKRIIRGGFLSFKRNGWLSMATIMVMSLVLFVLGTLIILGAFAQTVLTGLESKIDVSVFFVPEAKEADIFQVRDDLKKLPQVREVSYVSKEEALASFKEHHKSNTLISQALDELGANPLQASLNITVHESTDYAVVGDFLKQKNYPLVEKVNYFENQVVIERLGSIFTTVRGSGSILAFFLAFIAILVAFNTIRLAIYTMRDEIGIMRLVGGSTWFIRGPFLVSGIFYGAIAAVLTVFCFLPLIWLIAPKIQVLVPEFNLFTYFVQNILPFFGVLFTVGILLGTLSSFIAIRKYLKI